MTPKGTGRIVVADATPRHTRIWGIGGYRPARVVPNAELVSHVDSSDEWIRERTGIRERRFARPDEDLVELATPAAVAAVDRAGVPMSAVDCVVVATVTHHRQTPAAAPVLADRLGLRCAAFDIGAACAGYCHALAIAHDLVRGGSAHFVLVVGVEKLSDVTDLTDRGTAFLFADGAGAAVVGPSDTPGIGPTVWGSDGSRADLIASTRTWPQYRDDPAAGFPTIGMQGQPVFRWAVYAIAPIVQKALDAAGVTAADLDAFIPHQANARIVGALAKTLRLPEDVVVARDIVDTGNTSAASIPLATERLLREGLVPSGALAVQVGFGAGLVYAAQVVVLP